MVNYQEFKNMAEDYVMKSQVILKEYLEKYPEKAEFSRMAVPITALSWTKGTVEVKNEIYGLWEDEEYEEHKFEVPENIDKTSTYILKREFEIAEIKPFLNELRNLGFYPLVFNFDNYEKIYPFFSIN